MIRVDVKLFATLRRQFPDLGIGESLKVQLADGATVEGLVQKLRLPRERVRIIVVNNTIQRGDSALSDGDEVGLFPAVGGG
jgi:molybdopterin synthase sulfur carrier subunit